MIKIVEKLHNTANETVAISLRSANFSSSSSDTREACIDASNGDIDTDNSLSCSITGKTLDGVTTGGGLISTSNAYDYTKYNSLDSATTLSFNASTFVTAAYSEN